MNWIKHITFFAVLLTAVFLFGDEATNQFNAAKTAFDNGQYDSAKAGFETFLKQFPSHAQTNAATFYLAESLMYLRQYPQAEVYFSRLTALGLNDQFSKAALFRLAEIPYIQGQLDLADQRLEEFVDQLPHDINLQFVLYYLGDIAMRSSAANSVLKAEFYFDQAVRMFPEGERVLESQLGLAWAKNKLNKITEANAIYAQLMSSTNSAVVEQATYQWGTALFERGSYQEAINMLTDFQGRYLASAYFADSQRLIARCKGRLNDFEGAIQILSQISQPTPDDLLMKVRCLYGLKRFAEAKSILDEAKRVAGTTYRDEIALLEAVFLTDQKDWKGAIALLESVLVPQFDAVNNRMIINYQLLPLASGVKRLSEEATFRACSFLAVAYANNRQSDKANALLSEMRGQAALSGNLRLTTICTDTASQLANITTTPSRGLGGGSGSYAGRSNDQQWSPTTGQGLGNRTQNQTVLSTGTDLTKFWRADQLYRTKNYAEAVQQLEQILSGYYNQISNPKQYIIYYNITGASGALDENTFAKACSMLALAKAQLGDMEQANAVVLTLATRIRMSDPVQENLLRETYDQLATIANGNGTTTGTGALLSDTDQRRLLREANSLFRQQRFDQTDEKLSELFSSNPAEAVLAEALLLSGKAKYQVGREMESIAMLERIVDELPNSKECPEALWNLGLYFDSCGDTFRSVEYFQTLADKFPNYKHIDGALYFLSVDDLMNGNGRTAATNLTRVYRTYKNGVYWSHATWMLAYEAYKKKNYTQAEAYIQEILRHPPDVAILDRVLYLKGDLALKRDDHESAFLAFREVVRLCAASPLSNHAMRNAQLAASKTVKIN